MAGVVLDWRIEFMAAHPRLFRAGHGYPECGEGWLDLLQCCCVRIERTLGEADQFHFTQIKEKYATLRAYWAGQLSPEASARVEEAIELAEARSACTCEVCGAAGRLHDRGGWLATACPDHAQGAVVPVRPGCENLHIVRHMVEGGTRITSCRRYDREADAFVDVDPGSLGIEE